MSTTSTNPVVVAALWGSKLLVYLGLFVGVGGAYFLAWLAPDQADKPRLPSTSIVAGLIAAPLAVGFQGADVIGVSVSAITQQITWRTGLETSFGLTAIVAEVALLAAIFALSTEATFVSRGLALGPVQELSLRTACGLMV